MINLISIQLVNISKIDAYSQQILCEIKFLCKSQKLKTSLIEQKIHAE